MQTLFYPGQSRNFLNFALRRKSGAELDPTLFQIIPDYNTKQTKIKHNTEVLRYSQGYCIKMLQIRDKKHDDSDDEKTDTELGFGFFVH